MLKPKLLSYVQEQINSFNRKPLHLLLKTPTVNATYDCKLQIVCCWNKCGINVFLWNDRSLKKRNKSPPHRCDTKPPHHERETKTFYTVL